MIEILLITVALALGSPAGPDASIECLPAPEFNASVEAAFGEADASVAAYAYTGTPRVVMRQGYCRVLANPNAFRHRKVAKAALIYAHELAHTRGVQDEHLASCEGVDQVKPLLKQLGYRRPLAARRTAERLARSWLAPTHQCWRR